MPFWKRFVATLIAMLIMSFIAGQLWQALFHFTLPSYLAGVIGGLTALPLWEFLKSYKPGSDTKP